MRYRRLADVNAVSKVVTGALLFGLLTSLQAADIRFGRDIRPILADNCFQCHGPDANARQADMRLDRRDDALADRGGFAAVVPGDPDASEIMLRVTAEDADLVMPPPETKKTLTKRQRQLLQQWIEQGANYEQHWSFQPITRPSPPAVVDTSWVKNDIDRFILARLRKNGIRPSVEADRATLVRRLYLDLIGLLPPPEAVKQFVESTETDAYSALVDHLLDSDHYGERWGRHWLDQARYADSNGYTIDGERVMWPFRDWVIKALNDDMPFDRFTVEQLAGDLLASPTKSQFIASGFHRNTLINQEGGTDDEQFRHEEVVDRVNTTGAVWLGLTIGCAQCHTHKFDPITQQEYYQLFSFFNQCEDVNDTGPTIEVSENELLLDDVSPAALEPIERARSAVAALDRSKRKRQSAWEKQLLTKADDQQVKWIPLAAIDFASDSGASLHKLEDGSILASRGAPMQSYTVAYDAPAGPIAAIRLRVIPHPSLPKGGPGLASNGNFILTEFEIRQAGKQLNFARVQASHAQPGYPINYAADGKPDTGWAINVAKGSSKKMNAPHEAHFILASPIEGADSELTIILRHQRNSKHYNIGRFAIDSSSDAPSAVLSPQLRAALATPVKQRNKQQQQLLAEEFAVVDSEMRAAQRQLADVKREFGLGDAVKTMVMRDRSQRRDTYLYVRGDFLRPNKQAGVLRPDVPAVFPALPADSNQPTRLDLANWLVRPDHPLTARVAVNRIWMRYFGHGLVETENDFGTQGAFPTHPELLDWLAQKFIDGGWSMKRLHHLIVHSATYRQTSTVRRELQSIDPLNRWLARQNRLRVDAEIIRDTALSASGLLEPKIGGPSVWPPQPDGVYAFTQQKKNWRTESGANRYRRTMYTFFYRSAPYPLLTTFDSPDFQSVCTARARSNTPLQSLTMANDASLFELSRGLGERLLREVPGHDSEVRRERANRAFLICFSRAPTDSELRAVLDYQLSQLAAFQADNQAAFHVAGGKRSPSAGAAVSAAWTSVARALMNTDEFITRE